MSQQVVIDYQGVSIEVKAQCDIAINSLCKIDKVLDRIDKTADKLETPKIKEYKSYLISSKLKIKNKIENLKITLEKYNEARAYFIDDMEPQYKEFLNISNNLKNESNQLVKIVNDLTGAKLAMIDQMIDEELLNAGEKTRQLLLNKMRGFISISKDMLERINSIEDIALRELVYRECLKEENKNNTYDENFSKAQEEYEFILGKKTRQVIADYKEELKSRGISTDKLDNVSSISEATVVANKAIADEQIRKETLKIIIKAIKDRGFIVDTNKNLKIDKKRNIVRLVALKASGQKVEFEIYLNGKFMYHFDEYEGKACREDIVPFLDDLKKIYGISITNKEIIFENPDKIQTQKYQYVNKNKGTN